MNKLPITAIILTYNEEINLPACLESIHQFVSQIIIVDSFSNDQTIEIAKRYTPDIYQNPFINYSKQFIFGLNQTNITQEWILRIDADERWTTKGFEQLAKAMQDDVDGIYVRMKIYFMGRWIKYGGFYPNLFLRVYRHSKGTLEDRWMDEHIKVDGKVVDPRIDVIEANYDRQENISLWTDKHNKYSTREAIEFLISKNRLREMDSIAKLTGSKTERKRWFKEKFYFHFPLHIRPFLYFFYRYFFQLGFLDGYRGFIFHILHAFWYRFLVDTKVYQIEELAKSNQQSIPAVIKQHYKIEI